jgi:hypothetical protein
MKKINIIIVIAILLIGASSCKQQIPYTNEVKMQYGLDDENLKSLQYHLVGDIVLTKGSSVNNNQLDKGEILVNESQNLDKVIFRAGTQGLFVKEIDDSKIAISFEKSDDFYLVFGATSVKGLYKFQASSWDNSGRGKLKYNGEDYVSSRASADAYITVKVKKSSQYNSSQRVAKGRKV